MLKYVYELLNWLSVKSIIIFLLYYALHTYLWINNTFDFKRNSLT